MSQAKVITVFTTKGGVGKTTSVIHIADSLRERGASVALIDADERAMLTETVMSSPESMPYPVFFLENPSGVEGDETSAQVIGEMVDRIEEAKDGHDYVLIDCGGYNSQASYAAAAVADLTIIPANTGRLDLVQTEEVYKKIHEISQRMGVTPLVRVVVTRVNTGTNLFAGFVGALKAKNINYLKTPLPTYAAVQEASFVGQSVMQYRPNSPAAGFMRRFADEVYEVLHGGDK